MDVFEQFYAIHLLLGDIAAGHTSCVLSLVTSNETFTKTLNPAAIAVSGDVTIDFAVGAFMDDGDTASVTVQVSGGAQDVDVDDAHFSVVRSPHA